MTALKSEPAVHVTTSQAEIERLAHRKTSGKEKTGRIAAYVGMGVIVLYCILPFYWMIVSSLRLPSEGLSTEFIPRPPSLENFAGVFKGSNHFGVALLRSVIVSTTVTVVSLTIGIVCSYALARLRFPGKSLVLGLVIAISMFPTITLLVPLLKMFTGNYSWFPFNWIDHYQALILPSLSGALPLTVWNLTAFFRQLPQELEQAAMVDGCTPGQAFYRVILPLAAPGVFTTAILTFIASWNDFLIPLRFGPNLQTATVAISKFTGSTGFDTPYGTIMAAGVIVTVPLLIMVLLFQRRIVAGLTAGGVK